MPLFRRGSPDVEGRDRPLDSLAHVQVGIDKRAGSLRYLRPEYGLERSTEAVNQRGAARTVSLVSLLAHISRKPQPRMP